MKEKKKIWIYVLILGGILFISALTYLLMIYVLDYKKENLKIKYTVDNPFIQNLYSYVDINSGVSKNLWNEVIELDSKKKVLYTSDLEQSIKNEMGYKYMSIDGMSVIECTDEINNLIEKSTNGLACGGIEYNDAEKVVHKTYTIKLDEVYLKKSVEKLFGPNSYKKIGFGTYFSGYMYSEKEKAYIYFEGIGGEFGETLLTSLESVNLKNNILTLNVRLYQEKTDNQDGYEYGKYNLSYKLSNNNYYLYSIEKVI